MNWKKTVQAVGLAAFTLTTLLNSPAMAQAKYPQGELTKACQHAANMKNRTVRIFGPEGFGTGFIVQAKDGKVTILTAKHVTDGQSYMQIVRHGSKTREGQLIADDTIDAALVSMEQGDDIPDMPLLDLRQPGKDESICLYSARQGYKTIEADVRGNEWINELDDPTVINVQTTVGPSTIPGDSGGVFVTEQGQIAGISSRASYEQNNISGWDVSVKGDATLVNAGHLAYFLQKNLPKDQQLTFIEAPSMEPAANFPGDMAR